MADTRYTPGQEKTIKTLDKPLFVAAGAGSGKTFTLTQRIVWALKEGSGADGKPYLSSLDQALIITFTNVAATEIKERVREALEKKAFIALRCRSMMHGLVPSTACAAES